MKKVLCSILAFIFVIGICFSAPITIEAFAVENEVVEENTNLILPDEKTGIYRYQLTVDGRGYILHGPVINNETGAMHESITDDITLPSVHPDDNKPIVELADNAFMYAGGITSVTIPGCYQKIGAYVFCDTTSLTSVTLQDGVEEIGMYAFSDCSSLTNVTFPDSITKVGEGVLSETAYLNSYENSEGVLKYVGDILIGSHTDMDVVVSARYGTRIIADAAIFGEYTYYLVPETVEYIGDYALGFFPSSDGYVKSEEVSSYIVGVKGSVAEIYANKFDFEFMEFSEFKNREVNGYQYRVSSDGSGYAIIANYSSSTLDQLVVPATYKGKDVVEISKNTFESNKVRKLEIPDSVALIDDKAFGLYDFSTNLLWEYNEHDENGLLFIGNHLMEQQGFSGALKLNNGIKSIMGGVFADNTQLTSVELPKSITHIADRTFEGCTALSKVILPSTIKTIGENAFKDCSFSSIVLGDDLVSIGKSAFMNCTNLTSITIPKNVSEIDDTAFIGCENLSEIIVDTNNKYYTAENGILYNKDKTEIIFCCYKGLETFNILDTIEEIDLSILSNNKNLASISVSPENGNYSCYDGVLYNKEGTELLLCPVSKTGVLTLLDSVEVIADNAFENSSLASVILNENLKTIGKEAFKNSKITAITIPSNVTILADGVFENCLDLASVTFKSNVTEIGDNCFYNCTKLEDIILPNSLVSIGNEAFYNNVALESISFGSNLKRIGDYAFAYCKFENVTIPSTVEVVGTAVFYYSSLKSVEINSKKVGKSAFASCYYLSKIIIGDSVEVIYGGAFDGTSCISDISFDANGFKYLDGFIVEHDYNVPIPSEFEFENGTKGFLSGIFLSNQTLTKITIPGTVKSIPTDAFSWCTSLTEVVIKDGVENIETGAFYGCEKLEKIKIPKSVDTIEGAAFDTRGMEGTGLKTIEIANDSPYFVCEDGVIYTKDKKTVVGFVNGIFALTGEGTYNVKTLELPETITEIQDKAFQGLLVGNLILPESLTDISKEMFGIGANLGQIVIPSSITKIPDYCFEYVHAKIVLPDTIEYIGAYALADTGIETLNLKNVEYIGEGAFYQTGSLLSVSISGSITRLPEKVFMKSGVEQIFLPNTITAIGESCFEECYGIREFAIPDSVTKISSRSFVNCINLEKVKISDSVKTIAPSAFFGCENLKAALVPESVIEIGEMALGYAESKSNSDSGSEVYSLRMSSPILRNAPRSYSTFDVVEEDVSAKKVPGFTIYGTEDTEAQDYANRNDMLFDSDENIHFCISSDWIVTKEPGCKTKGEKQKQCIDCKDVLQSETLPTSHNFVDGICEDCNVKKSDLLQSNHPYKSESDDEFDESWVLYNPEAKRIALTFSEDTAVSWGDEIYIYSGDTTDSNTGVTYNDLSLHEQFSENELADKRIVLQGNTALIRITCNDWCSSIYYGFELVNVEYFYEECSHDFKKTVGAVEATCVRQGYTGDLVCGNDDCLKLFKKGEEIPTEPHVFQDGICNCGIAEWRCGFPYSENEAFLESYNGNDSEVVVPSEINDNVIRGIYIGAFGSNKTITTIEIPNTVKVIDCEAFVNCSNIEKIILQDGLISINDHACFNTPSLKSITIPNTVTSIGSFALGYYYDEEVGYCKIENFTIYGVEGSEAQRYAIENGFTFIVADEHTCVAGTEWFTENGYHYHKCECGAELDKAACSGGTATCTSKAVCLTCGEDYGELDSNNHTKVSTEWTTENGYHYHKCECGAELDKAACSGGTATCKKKAVCTTCNKEYGDVNAKNHSGLKTLEAVASTCTNTGLTEGKKCFDCGEITVPQTVVNTKGHSLDSGKVTTAPTCTKTGVKTYSCTNSGCNFTKTETVPATGAHNQNTKIPGKAATCTATGLTDGAKCSVCGTETKAQQVIPATGHNSNTKIPGKAATCTATGLTEGAKCSACGEVTKAQQTVPATGHKTALVGKTDATFKVDGYTGDTKCTVCGAVTVKGNVIPKLSFTTPKVAIKNTAKGIEVNWNAVENAQSYVVYRRVYNTATKKWSNWLRVKTGYTSTSYVDETVALGTGYRYTVRAVNGDVMSAYTSTKTLKYDVIPTVKVANVGNGIKVTWSTVANATGYTVYSSTYNTKTKKWSNWSNRGTAKATSTSWVDKKASSGTQYKYTVRACNGANIKSSYKASANLIYLAQPTIKIANVSNGVKVSWNKIAGATSYYVYSAQFNPSTNKWSDWTNRGTVTTTSWTDSTAQSGVTYRYTVRAINGKTLSSYKATAGLIYLAQPTVKIANASTGVRVSWSQSTGALGYTVYRAELVNGKWSNWKNMGTAKAEKSSWVDKSAKSGTKYRYTVRAVNGSTRSTYKATGELLYLAQPTVTVKAVSNGINVAWTQSTGAKGYTVYRAELINGKWSNWKNMGTAKAEKSSWVDKSATAGVTYRYTVRAVNDKVRSTYVASTNVNR